MKSIVVEKKNDFAILNCLHLKDKELSLKAKGLLSILQCIDVSKIENLGRLCAEEEVELEEILQELVNKGYLTIIDDVYMIPQNRIGGDKKVRKEIEKHRYGENKKVLLTDEEYKKLQTELGQVDKYIKYLDEYITMKGYSAKSHYLVIKKWVIDAVKREEAKSNYKVQSRSANITETASKTSWKGQLDEYIKKNKI